LKSKEGEGEKKNQPLNRASGKRRERPDSSGIAPGIAPTFGGVAGEDDFQRERPDELVEAERAGGGRESWRRQREPAEAERAGGGRERRRRQRAPEKGESAGRPGV
jgi:hypothetical protein